MKKIGMLGGMSWESTAKYYEYLNVGIREKLGLSLIHISEPTRPY